MKRTTIQLVEAARRAERTHVRFKQIGAMTPMQLRQTFGSDAAAAEPWIRSAAAHGVAEAQFRLGAMLLEGTGAERQPATALLWFKRAAQAGHAEAMNMVGRCYENGWGIQADEVAAARWYRRSAEAGHDWGEYNFAHMLFDGRGAVPQDQVAAYALYWSAAQKGHARAMNLVARCLEAGWGVDADRIGAARWYERSAQAGYFRAQFNHAGLLLEQGRIAEAIEWLQRAEGAGDEAMRAHVQTVLGAIREKLRAAFEGYAARCSSVSVRR